MVSPQRTTTAWALVLGLLLCALPASTAHAQTLPFGLELGKVGIAGGLSLSQGDDLGDAASFESSAGYHIGVLYDQPLPVDVPGTLAIRSGLVFRSVATYEFAPDLPEPNAFSLADRSFNVYSFEIPIDVRYQFDQVEVTKPYVLLGPNVSIFRAEEDLDEVLKNAAFGINVGVGTEYEIPNAFGLIVAPEIRYTLGITNAVEEDATLRFRDLMTDGSNFSDFGLRVNVYYPLQ